MPESPNPYQEAALESAANLASGLDFLVQRTIGLKDPEQCCAEDLIRAVAASPTSTREAIKLRLAMAYGKDFAARRWLAAVKEAKEDLISQGPVTGLQISSTGAIKNHLENAAISLGSILTLGFNEFSSKVELLKPSPWGSSGVWTDQDGVRAARWLHRKTIDVSEVVANRAAFSLAIDKPFNPVRDYLTSREWDGKPRIDEWMVESLGVADTCLHRLIAAAYIISMVKRIMEPGCKADYCIVLDGKQRQGKSSVLRALCNGHLAGTGGIQWFRDRLPKLGHKDFELMLQGVWLIELQELGAIRGAAWEDIKAVLSSQTDTFRSPYGYNIQDYPRQMVFAGTTNKKQWGGDDTGLTRFWPFTVGHTNPEWMLENRDQVFAEAMVRYRAGALSYLTKEEEAEAETLQADRMADNPWIERVAKKLEMNLDGDTSVRELQDTLGRSDANVHVLSEALLALGWEQYRESKPGRPRRYRRPG